ncbi:6,7-dimethyl-8-ribityllumazine synthase [Buchnera aphidicola (Therioaphis trifolii)]|uniref:6,7-dimethyl-8-ribityllumazine synthase n=1 Tax=Buchnera aphidicola (Therioaphis trifolii) TaxID=1241884 RepID=A0A4D6YDR4_9GAMM|nr:6,7-dimethyl-8-ribityllumazine synthase [Buchnera aphidicola]QCI27399.1 6,7-dimethyl-8-ribityllumazine synthase [Buchnera aphidicola (Therioaphis trifolii)]
MQIIEGDLISENSKIAIVIPRFNNFINQNLLNGAIDILIRIGKIKNKNITIIKIPGSYEIPIILNNISSFLNYDGIITLGTIIKGETEHFKVLSSNITSKISEISLKNNIPISLGILMTDTIEQAINRSGLKFGNKGSEAALVVLEMINIIKKIKNKN